MFPNAGAYTVAGACDFNGIEFTTPLTMYMFSDSAVDMDTPTGLAAHTPACSAELQGLQGADSMQDSGRCSCEAPLAWQQLLQQREDAQRGGEAMEEERVGSGREGGVRAADSG